MSETHTDRQGFGSLIENRESALVLAFTMVLLGLTAGWAGRSLWSSVSQRRCTRKPKGFEPRVAGLTFVSRSGYCNNSALHFSPISPRSPPSMSSAPAIIYYHSHMSGESGSRTPPDPYLPHTPHRTRIPLPTIGGKSETIATIATITTTTGGEIPHSVLVFFRVAHNTKPPFSGRDCCDCLGSVGCDITSPAKRL